MDARPRPSEDAAWSMGRFSTGSEEIVRSWFSSLDVAGLTQEASRLRLSAFLSLPHRSISASLIGPSGPPTES